MGVGEGTVQMQGKPPIRWPARAGALALAAWCGVAVPAAPTPAGQAAPTPPPAWMHHAWTARDHAPRFVQSLAQDSDGFLWVGSVEGLFRFDGTTFEPVPPPPGHPRAATAVSALAAAPDGTIWLGYAGGGGVAVYRQGRLHDAGRPGNAGEITRIVIGADGQPWIAAGDADHAVYRHTPAGWQAVESASFDRHDTEPQLLSRSGTLWFGTWGGPLSYWRGGSGPVQPHVTPFAGPGGGALAQTTDGALYAIDNAGLRALPPYDMGSTAAPPRALLAASALPPADFYRAVADPFGRIWATTFLSGVVAIWPRTGALEHIDERQGLTSNRASPILADRDGNIWVGTERGLDRFSPTPLRSLAMLGPRAAMGISAAAQDGRVYFANGPAVFVADAGQSPRLLTRLDDGVAGLCAGSGGDVWAMLSESAVAIAGPHRGQSRRLPGHVTELFDCAVAPDGVLWFTANGLGLSRYVGGRWENVPVDTRLGVPQNLAFDRQGRLVMILGRRAIARLDHGALTVWDGARIGFERPTSLAVRDDDVLVGGGTGLLRLSEGSVQILDVRDHPWLFDTRGAISTPAGETWLLGYHGLVRVATAALDRAFAAPTRPIAHTTFDEDDRRIALPQRSAARQIMGDGTDRVFVLTRSGVLEARSWSSPLPEAPFRLFVRALGANGRDWPAGPDIALPQGTSQVTIRYGVLDLATASQRRFRVRLSGPAGLDDAWTANGTAPEISYANLVPGTYRFDVQTTDRQGEWQAQGASLAFTIRAAFWQTVWFRLGLAALILLLARALYVQRTRVLLARARAKREGQMAERERIARELHDTLLQGVQGLMLRFEAVAARGALDRATRAELAAVLERGDDVVTAARERVIDLRSQTASAVDLAQAMAPICADGLVPAASLRITGRPRAIDAAVAEDILAVVQEALVNARRHARAQGIAVLLHFGPRALIVRIADDGVGFAGATGSAPQAVPGHFGLVGMRERAHRLNARIDIRNGAAGGAVVELRVPAALAYRA